MSQELLPKVDIIISTFLEKKAITKNTDLVIFLQSYKSNDIIYPNALLRKFPKLFIDIEDVYVLLNKLLDINFLKLCYEFICENCHECSIIYDHISEITEDPFCEKCGIDLDVNKNLKVIYKKNE